MQKKSETRVQNSKRRIGVIVMLLILAIALYLISGTYSRYTWKGETTGTVAVAKWQVGLSDTQTTELNVDFNIDGNTDVVSGKIAPGSTATGEFSINPKGSETSVDYKLVIDETALQDVGAHLTIDQVLAGETELTAGADNSYTGTIKLNGTALTDADTVNIKVKVKWTDDGATADNLTENGYGNNVDTKLGLEGRTLQIPVKVQMQQHI